MKGGVTGAMETQYLSFFCDGINYIIPLGWVLRVADARAVTEGELPDGFPEYELCRPRDCGESGDKRAFMLLLKNDSKALAVRVDAVEGIVAPTDTRPIKLPQLIRSGDNGYLDSVMPRQTGGKLSPAYIIDPDVLYLMAQSASPERDAYGMC